ncbi:MAG: hypothetical protein HWE11_16305 [Gammaproteobacteria bacterium]|nr:hypothetical protein [Gammaproteobacteria bacterium]
MKKITFTNVMILVITLVSTLPLKAELSAFQQYQNNPTLDNVGIAFAAAINARNDQQLNQLMNYDKLFDRTFDIVGNPKAFKNFRVGFQNGASSRMFASWYHNMDQFNGKAMFRQVVNIEGELRPFILIDIKDAGFIFVELIVDEKSHRIIDMFIHSNGELISQTFAEMVSLIKPESSNYFKQLLGVREANTQFVAVIKEVAQFQRNGNYEAAYKRLKQLKGPLGEARVISMMRLNIAGLWSDYFYYQELERINKLHGDNPKVFFTLLDYLFQQKQYGKVNERLTKLYHRLGEDPYIGSLIAFNLARLGKDTEALTMIEKLINAEPNNESYYWIKFEALVSAKAYTQAIAVVDQIAEKFAMTFDEETLALDDFYQDFIASPEFKQWQSQQ